MGELLNTQAISTKKLWLIPMVFCVAQQSFALGFGEIQVNSYLGEPLKAQVVLLETEKNYETSLKIRLASPEEYKKNGYAYPYDIKFKFNVVNETGKQPTVIITTSRPIQDPYLNLLLEASSPQAQVIRMFTFLIDPTPELFGNQDVIATNQEAVVTTPASDKPENSISAPVADLPADAPVHRPRHHAHPPNNLAHRAAKTARMPSYKSRLPAESNSDNPLSNKLSLSLSTSLSISSSDPSSVPGARETSDALQEELIAKQKTLGELNSQISEMQTLIKGLQIKLSMTAASAIGSSGVLSANAVQDGLAASGMGMNTVVSPVVPAPKVKITAPVSAQEKQSTNGVLALFQVYAKELLAGLAIIALALFGFIWNRKRKLQTGVVTGDLFDDLNHTNEAEKIAEAAVKNEEPPAALAPKSAVVTKTLAVGEQSVKVPAYKEQKVQAPAVSPEYDLLEEADIYLRFGHDKLAEEVLRDALKINAANPEIYLNLLGIFDTRGDAAGFEKIALELKPIADNATWQKVVEMGRKLEIGNPLYR